jgi:hypothetical protein
MSRVPCSALWPSPGGPIASLHWHELAARAGAVNHPLARPCLLAIRGAAPGDQVTHELEHKPSPPYRDTGVLYVPGEEPLVFPMTTTAYQRDSKASPDVDRDGRGDVGSIRPGRYVLHNLRAGAEVTFHVKRPDGSDRIPAWRDFDHSGTLTPEEMQRSEDARAGQQVGAEGTYATSILLHGGMDEPPGPNGAPAQHRFSIGCLTAQRRWRQAIATAALPHGGLCDLVLVNAVDLLPIVEQLEQPAALANLTPEDLAVDGDSDAPPAGVA